MDDHSKPSIGITLDEAAMAQVRRSAERDQRIAENDALNRIQPGQSETAKAVRLDKEGSAANDNPPLANSPKPWGIWTPWGTGRS